MSISGKILYNKVQSLRSDFSNIITPELLDKICNEPSVQPFLNWFCENVNYVNVLSNEDILTKNKLQETHEWLEGLELDDALKEATKDYPDLLKIISFDVVDINDLFAEFEITKDSYKEDENYMCALRTGIQNLKNLEATLDENIEKEKEFLNIETIETDKACKDCSVILKDSDTCNHVFFKKVECLLNIYADAAENKGTPLLWTQMPLELFIEKLELYNCYLDDHIKQQFGNINKKKLKYDSNYVSSINNSKEECMHNEKLQELTLCKTNLCNAKIEEILTKIQEKSYVAMFSYIKDIYNLGNLKIPRHSELRTEILKLTGKRDFLEQNITRLQEQLTEVVQQLSELEITKVLKQDAHAKLEQGKNHLEKIKNLRFLAREHGHVHTDLLQMLMEMQFHHLKNVSEFVTDAYHYLTTEYLLSSTRCESMRQQQNEYIAISEKVYNALHKLFIAMIYHGDNTYQLSAALDKYNDLVNEKKTKKQFILKTYLNSKIYKLETLENEVSSQYLNEMQNGPTYTFKQVSYEMETCYNDAFDILQKIQIDLTKMRNQMKERLKTNTSFERQKAILWQRFLIDFNSVKRTY